MCRKLVLQYPLKMNQSGRMGDNMGILIEVQLLTELERVWLVDISLLDLSESLRKYKRNSSSCLSELFGRREILERKYTGNTQGNATFGSYLAARMSPFFLRTDSLKLAKERQTLCQ